jgi:hypothetical protein
MKLRTAVLTVAGALLAAVPAFAGSVSYSFNVPGGKLGTSQSYTSGTLTITAYGYKCDASSATSKSLTKCKGQDLYGKNDGVGETGLGIYGEDDNEIGWNGRKDDYVMGLNLSNLYNAGVTSVTLDFGSVQKGENYTLWGYSSNPFGTNVTLSNQIVSVFGNSNSTADYTSTIALNSGDQFLVINALCGDVLLDSASGTVPNATPEPGTLLLLGTGLALGAFVLRRSA